MNPHVTRWLTGILAAPVLVLVIGWGSEAVFVFFITVIVAAAAVEYSKMVFAGRDGRNKRALPLVVVIIMAAAFIGGAASILAALTLSVLVLFSMSLLRRDENARADLDGVRHVFLGALYIAVTLSHFLLVRAGEDGRAWIFFLVVMAFSSDITAFYVGRTWGRRKLMPSVSAGKTVEGAVGGIVGCMAGCTVYAAVYLPDLWIAHALLMGFLGSILGQLGDLSESLIKRESLVKDSGILIPGHGGILDRLDSFIFMAPFVYYYTMILL